MEIYRKNTNWRGKESSGSSSVSKDSAILEINSRSVRISKNQIENMCQEFAKVAYKLGETNDQANYADEMAGTIFTAYKEFEERQRKEKKKRKIRPI
ncbi:MAG: hypothetical protein HRT90_00075 [Candidatus Margulisbacteria bacterium]|nr:hypothetical protein [Candidatus Margulisiibacteriota bacterium]